MKTPTIEQVAAMAWDLMKPDDDPMFSGCHQDHQSKLIYHAQDVQKTGVADDPFEKMVAAVLADTSGAIAALKAKYAEPVEITPENTVVNLSPDTAPPEPAKPKRGKK